MGGSHHVGEGLTEANQCLEVGVGASWSHLHPHTGRGASEQEVGQGYKLQSLFSVMYLLQQGSPSYKVNNLPTQCH